MDSGKAESKFFGESFVQYRRKRAIFKQKPLCQANHEDILNKVNVPQHNSFTTKSFIPGINKSLGDSPLLAPSSLPLNTLKIENNRGVYCELLPHDFRFENYRGNGLYKTDLPIFINGETVMIESAIKDIVFNRPPAPMKESEQPSAESYICPISFVPITCPGRGVDCNHQRCFDLREFLLLQMEEIWRCPICGIRVTFIDLRYDPFYFKPRKIPNRGDDISLHIFDHV